ncbi:MAG: pro-sigmaK processing inhibitor BofA family protein [Candidatus Altiarchaeota archaeon]|nr:pro-sigmaK processing inhibitor BofA family protein [Candidatus Altiarchaeota archaeon]
MGKHFMINTIVGILLLLILIHVLGVGIQITILALIITAVFGIPGVIFIVMLHYLGIPL